MAKVKELHIRMSRKISDDNYGSFGVEGEIFLELDDKDDKDEMWAYGTSWLSAKLTGTHKAHGTVSSQPTSNVEIVHIDTETGAFQRAQPTPLPAGSVAKPAPVAQDAQQEDVFDVDSIVIEVMPDGVTKTAKAKGGKWTKYGVKVWDEVLALPPLEWDLQELDVAEYGPPKGLQAIVMMVDDKPKKVTGWK